MVDETRQNLDKATDELIESFAKFDKNKALQLKLGLQAVHNAQKDLEPDKKINLYAVCNHEMLHDLLTQHGISRDEFDAVPEIIAGGTQNPEQLDKFSSPLRQAIEELQLAPEQNLNVPSPAMVAVMFNMVQEKVKNALQAGQAGERTLKAIERASSVSYIPVMKEALLKDTLYDYGDKKRLARPYIDGIDQEPGYLISAKATHHLADLFETSLKLYPPARDLEEISLSINGFNCLAASIFRNAADNLSQASLTDAASKIDALASHVEKNHPTASLNSACNAVETGMAKLREAMHNDGIITEQEADDYAQLVVKRIEQIKRVEVVSE